MNDLSQTSKKSNRSISQEYLVRTNKKSHESMSVPRNERSQLFGYGTQPISYVNDSQMMSANSAQREPVINHIMKQINSLKCENLELKKIIHQRSRSSKNVSISQPDYDLPSIKSVNSSHKKRKASKTNSRSCSRSFNLSHSYNLSNKPKIMRTDKPQLRKQQSVMNHLKRKPQPFKKNMSKASLKSGNRSTSRLPKRKTTKPQWDINGRRLNSKTDVKKNRRSTAIGQHLLSKQNLKQDFNSRNPQVTLHKSKSLSKKFGIPSSNRYKLAKQITSGEELLNLEPDSQGISSEYWSPAISFQRDIQRPARR